jgi:hypothetical protein
MRRAQEQRKEQVGDATRAPAIALHAMQLLFFCALLLLIAAATAYPWGTNSCGPPGHGSGASSDATGLTIKMDGSKAVLSSTRGAFKGFYMKSDQNLRWTDTPAGASARQFALSMCRKKPRATQVPLAARYAAERSTPSCFTRTPKPRLSSLPTLRALPASLFPYLPTSCSPIPPRMFP